jgi:hypothetical protein
MTLPAIDPRALRPRRVWYVVAIVIAVLGVVAGVVGFAYGVTSFFRALPTMSTEFDAGSPATVHLASDRRQAIYFDLSGPRRNQLDTECTGTARDDGSIDVRPIWNTLDFARSGHSWTSAYTVQVTRAGEYELTCRPTASDGPTHYGVGDAPNNRAMAVAGLGGMAALVGAPGLAVTIGGVIALTVARRRSSHKKRVQQQFYHGHPAS